MQNNYNVKVQKMQSEDRFVKNSLLFINQRINRSIYQEVLWYIKHINAEPGGYKYGWTDKKVYQVWYGSRYGW